MVNINHLLNSKEVIRMKKSVLVFLCILSILMAGGSALAQSPLKYEFSFGTGYMMGDTTFKTNGNVYIQNRNAKFTREMELPTDVMMATAAFTVGSATDSWRINASLSKNVTEDAGTMKDLYWLKITPIRINLFSKGNTDLDAMALDINADYRFYQRQNLALYAGVGFRHNDYGFDTKYSEADLSSPERNYHSTGSVKAFYTNKADFNLAYLTLGSQFDLNNMLHLYAKIGYAYTKSTDKKYSPFFNGVYKSDYDGDALLLSIAARFDLNPNWFLTGKIDYQRIEGDSKRGGHKRNIKIQSDDIESQQTTLSVAIGYSF